MSLCDKIPGRRLLWYFGPGRSLLYQLVSRDFKQRYVGSILGWLWGVIHPLVMLAVYTLIFRFAFSARVPTGDGTDNYPLFLLAGLLPWLLFSETLSRSATALTEYAVLIKKSVFPAELVPLSVLGANGIVHLLSLIILLVALLASTQRIHWTLLFLPLHMGLLCLFSLGLSWIVAGLQVYMRDTVQVLTVILTGWFWLTPIVLPESYYQGKLAILQSWNPVLYVVRGYRESIFGGVLSDPIDLLRLGAFSLVVFLVGGLFFRRVKRGFADVM